MGTTASVNGHHVTLVPERRGHANGHRIQVRRSRNGPVVLSSWEPGPARRGLAQARKRIGRLLHDQRWLPA